MTGTFVRSAKRLREDVLERPILLAIAARRYPDRVKIRNGVSDINLPEATLDALAQEAGEAAHRAIEDLTRLMGVDQAKAVALFWDALADEATRQGFDLGFGLIAKSQGQVKAKDPGMEDAARHLLQRAANHPSVAIEMALDVRHELEDRECWENRTWGGAQRAASARAFVMAGMAYLENLEHWEDGWWRDEALTYQELLMQIDRLAVKELAASVDWDNLPVEEEDPMVEAVLEQVSA